MMEYIVKYNINYIIYINYIYDYMYDEYIIRYNINYIIYINYIYDGRQTFSLPIVYVVYIM
jgi:hypothetical protein